MKNISQSQFDRNAIVYDKELQKGLILSGENKAYFAQARVKWMAHQFSKINFSPKSAIDYGCGIGTTSPILMESLNLQRVIGVDVSKQALDQAVFNYSSSGIQFINLNDYVPEGNIDIVYCNGVFHHIPTKKHRQTLKFFHSSLCETGLIALWENNPWNLATRLAMKLVPFDSDAKMLWPAKAKKLLIQSHFKIINESYLFIFPKFMRFFRKFEPLLSEFPIGGQYLILGKKSP